MKYIKIILIAIIFIGCSKKGKNEFKPFEELNDMKIVNRISGKEAQSMIDKLHGKSVTPDASNIVFYKGEKGEAILYVSIYSDSNNAKTDYNKMVHLIRDGNEVFGHFHEFIIDNQKLSMCFGMGQAHYFFYKANRLFWLSTNFQIAQSTVVDLLNKLR